MKRSEMFVQLDRDEHYRRVRLPINVIDLGRYWTGKPCCPVEILVYRKNRVKTDQQIVREKNRRLIEKHQKEYERRKKKEVFEREQALLDMKRRAELRKVEQRRNLQIQMLTWNRGQWKQYLDQHLVTCPECIRRQFAYCDEAEDIIWELMECKL